jgi:two-component system phosphate regulon sensor histidine kinase PhoR
VQRLDILAAIVLVPLMVLAALAVADGIPLSHAAIAAAIIAACGALLAWLVRRDLQRLARLARRAPSIPPSLPPFGALYRAIERLMRGAAAAEALAASRQRGSDTIVERHPDPLILLGAGRGVKSANAAAREAFGGDLAAVLRHPALLDAIERAFTATQGGQAMVDLSVPVPVWRDIHATVIVFDPPLPDDSRALVVLSDRTRERAVERTRADFVANASHELRTPLASLIGFIETLRGPAADDPPAQQRFLGIMAEQAERMNRLIDDLLSLSRIEISEHIAPSTPVALAPLIQRCIAGFEPRLQARQATIALDVAGSLPHVPADADQIMQVLQNLIDNAVKYGRPGGTIAIAAHGQPRGAGFPARPGVVIRIADDGPGIAREHLPRLTERFYRVDKGRSRDAGGTGLGLAIVKHIVNRHRGTLQIDSAPGKGTSIQLWLPVSQN